MDKTEFKVLLIEDNAGDAFLIKFYLGESFSPKFSFYHAETIQSAYEFLSKDSFDIILMDLNLPDSVGLETIKNLLEKFPNNLVVVLTGLTDEKVGLVTVRYGAQDFLVKGKFDGKVLISSILFAFERFNLNKQIQNASLELNKGDARFRNLQEILKVGYIEMDIENMVLYTSPTLLKILGSPAEREKLQYHDALELVENKDEVLAAVEKLIKEKGQLKVEIIRTENHSKLNLQAEIINGKFVGVVFPS